jgi:hypothetical protein
MTQDRSHSQSNDVRDPGSTWARALPRRHVEIPLNEHALWTLTPTERLILANQYAILEALFPANRASYASSRQQLETDVAAECSSVRPDRNTPKDRNRPEPAHQRCRAAGAVDRGGALTPW